ncbi:MAG TPA: linear amide C-N hydrolase [Ignavibacteria bacterium]
MRKQFLSLALLCTFIALSISCTTFLLKTDTELVFGKNYDFSVGFGLVFVNKKGIEKIALTETSPAKWISKYGSVTFNQFGREAPSGGINEAGLVVELMWLDGSQYPDADQRPDVGGVLSWIQYQLDNSSSIEDVISSDKNIRIPKNDVPLHYLVADKYGNSVTIEFLTGKLVYHTGESMPQKVLTNDTYENSVSYLMKFEGFGGDEKITNNKSSLNRFVNACSMVKSFSPSEGVSAIDYGFNILTSVAQGEHTKWSIVYDIKNLIVYFKTDMNSKIKNIDLKQADFKCVSDVKMIDINNDFEGNINSQMVSYSYDANRKLIGESFSNVGFLKDTPQEVLDMYAKYPESLNCTDKSQIDLNKHNQKTSFGLPFGLALGFLILSAVLLWKFKRRRI